MITYGPWREVGARRARKLRKAYRCAEIKRTTSTSTGKPRYLWRQTYGIWMRKSALQGYSK